MIAIIIVLVALLLLVGIWFLPTDNETSPKEPEKSNSRKDIPNILGASHFKLRHKKTTDDTLQKPDCKAEKDNTFVSSEEFEEDNEPLDIDFPLYKEEDINEADLIEEEEELESLFGEGAELATGVDFENLFTTKKVIETTSSSLEEEQQAGKVLFENQHTILFEELISKQKSTSIRIASLVDIHLSKLNEENPNHDFLDQASDNYNRFNINDFINY